VTGRQGTGKRYRELLPVAPSCENWNRDPDADTRDGSTFLVFGIAALALQVARQPPGGSLQSLAIKLRQLSIEKVFEQLSAHVTIKKNMLEFVLETPEASIARGITIFGTGFQQFQRPLAEFDSAFDEQARKTRTA
jgi:hypothetical protein